MQNSRLFEFRTFLLTTMRIREKYHDVFTNQMTSNVKTTAAAPIANIVTIATRLSAEPAEEIEGWPFSQSISALHVWQVKLSLDSDALQEGHSNISMACIPLLNSRHSIILAIFQIDLIF